MVKSRPFQPLFNVRLNVLQGLTIVRNFAIPMVFLLMAWRTVETLAPTNMLDGHTLAVLLSVIYEAAIQTGLLVVRGPSEDCWWYVEPKVDQEKCQYPHCQIPTSRGT